MDGDFGAKLDRLLANPAMMAQIRALADTITADVPTGNVEKGTEAGTVNHSGENHSSGDSTPGANAPGDAATHETGGLAPLSTSSGEKSIPSLAGLLSLPKGILPPASSEKTIKQTRALLLSLKPFLDRSRGERIDKLLGMMRLAEMAGYFKEFL